MKPDMPSWDLPLLKAINVEWSHPWLDYWMPAVSAIEAWIPLFVIAGLWLAWKGGRGGRFLLIGIGIAVGLGDGVVSKSLKGYYGRVRPRDDVAGLVVRDLGNASPAFMRLFVPTQERISTVTGEVRGKSTPSSHAVNMFAFATVVALSSRRWGWLLYAIAFSVAYSRIYVAAHWPSDLPISIGIGILMGFIGHAFVVWARRRWPDPAPAANA